MGPFYFLGGLGGPVRRSEPRNSQRVNFVMSLQVYGGPNMSLRVYNPKPYETSLNPLMSLQVYDLK